MEAIHYQLRTTIDQIQQHITTLSSSTSTRTHSELLHLKSVSCITSLHINPLLTLSLYQYYFIDTTKDTSNNNENNNNNSTALHDIILHSHSYKEFMNNFVKETYVNTSNTTTNSSNNSNMSETELHDIVYNSPYLLNIILSFIIASLKTQRCVPIATAVVEHIVQYFNDIPSDHIICIEQLQYIAIIYDIHKHEVIHSLLNKINDTDDNMNNSMTYTYLPLIYKLAFIAYDMKQYNKSIELFKYCATAYYHQIECLTMIGKCYMKLLQYRNAIEIWQYTQYMCRKGWRQVLYPQTSNPPSTLFIVHAIRIIITMFGFDLIS